MKKVAVSVDTRFKNCATLKIHIQGIGHGPYLPTVVFMDPALLWFSAFLAVLAGVGHTAKISPQTKILFLYIFYHWQIA